MAGSLTRGGPSGSTSATAGRSSRCSTTGCCPRPCPSIRQRPSTRTGSSAIGCCRGCAQEPLPGDAPPLVVIATDGELYGHHQPLRDHFLARLVGRAAPPGPALRHAGAGRGGRTSRGVGAAARRTCAIGRRGAATTASPAGARAASACRTARWKGPLRSALDRLAGGVDAATEHAAARPAGQPGPVGRARRLRRRPARSRDRRLVRGRWLAPAATASRTRDVRGGHGSAALAARDVRELRLVLGGAGPHRDRGSASRRRCARHGSSTAWPAPTSSAGSSRTWRSSPPMGSAARRGPRGRRRGRPQERTSFHSTLIVPTSPLPGDPDRAVELQRACPVGSRRSPWSSSAAATRGCPGCRCRASARSRLR